MVDVSRPRGRSLNGGSLLSRLFRPKRSGSVGSLSLASRLCFEGRRRPSGAPDPWGSWGNALCGPEAGWRAARRWLRGGAFGMSSSLRLGLGLDHPGLELGLLSRVPAKGWALGSC